MHLSLFDILLAALLVALIAAYQPFSRSIVPPSIAKNPALSSSDKAITNKSDNELSKESQETVSSAKKISKMVAMLNTIKKK